LLTGWLLFLCDCGCSLLLLLRSCWFSLHLLSICRCCPLLLLLLPPLLLALPLRCSGQLGFCPCLLLGLLCLLFCQQSCHRCISLGLPLLPLPACQVPRHTCIVCNRVACECH